MEANAADIATPRVVAQHITRAWVGYFLVVTVAGVVLSFVVGGLFQLMVRTFDGNPYAMRFAIMAASVAVNAPVSYLAFQWAVRAKVVPAVQAWTLTGDAPAQGQV
jgi:hypothetical protein